MDPTETTPAPPPAPPADRCTCAYRMLRGVETRITNPRCPDHGARGHLQMVR